MKPRIRMLCGHWTCGYPYQGYGGVGLSEAEAFHNWKMLFDRAAAPAKSEKVKRGFWSRFL